MIVFHVHGLIKQRQMLEMKSICLKNLSVQSLLINARFLYSQEQIQILIVGYQLTIKMAKVNMNPVFTVMQDTTIMDMNVFHVQLTHVENVKRLRIHLILTLDGLIAYHVWIVIIYLRNEM